MNQLLYFKSKFPNHFASTLGRYLFYLFIFGSIYLMWMLTIVVYIYIGNYSCSLKCIEKNS